MTNQAKPDALAAILPATSYMSQHTNSYFYTGTVSYIHSPRPPTHPLFPSPLRVQTDPICKLTNNRNTILSSTSESFLPLGYLISKPIFLILKCTSYFKHFLFNIFLTIGLF